LVFLEPRVSIHFQRVSPQQQARNSEVVPGGEPNAERFPRALQATPRVVPFSGEMGVTQSVGGEERRPKSRPLTGAPDVIPLPRGVPPVAPGCRLSAG
jgi:hypothetical protein